MEDCLKTLNTNCLFSLKIQLLLLVKRSSELKNLRSYNFLMVSMQCDVHQIISSKGLSYKDMKYQYVNKLILIIYNESIC